MPSNQRTHILVVDDDEAVRALISEALRIADFDCTQAGSAYEALDALRDTTISLVVLDISMPGIDGHQLLSRMRGANDKRPVLVVTARQEHEDLARSFEFGADDFLRKPFSIEELVWRCKALVRRLATDYDEVLQQGPVSLDPKAHKVTLDGRVIDLSATEFRLLEFMMANAGQVLARRQLLQRVWGYSDVVDTSVVDTYISYLRRKLAPHEPLRTVRGVGYEFKRLS